jgi:hypothetical protein
MQGRRRGAAGRLLVRAASTALVVALAVPLGGTALAQTPPLVNWGEVVPTFHPGLDPSSSNICTSGSHRCVESVLRAMSREFHQLARRCDHKAIFQLGYLRTTEAYYESSQIPGFYADVPWMHHYDAVFAEYYLAPQRSWARGDAAAVPPAWREAFAAAEGRELSAVGDFLMGMNAHINRDLPLVLAEIGLTAPDGSSRKPDHERVNAFLNQVGDDLSPEMAARFDPTWDTSADDDLFTGLAVQQVIQEWRERAWTAAWMMAYAPAPIPDLVRQAVETGAAEIARDIRAATAVTPEEAAARDAWCAEHWDDWAGGDGTFFDGEAEPAVGAATVSPVLAPVAATTDLAALAALGVQVDVSPAAGVSITLVPPTPVTTQVTGVVTGTVGRLLG